MIVVLIFNFWVNWPFKKLNNSLQYIYPGFFTLLFLLDKLESHRISSDTCCVTLPPCIVFFLARPPQCFSRMVGTSLPRGEWIKRDDRFVKYSRKKRESDPTYDKPPCLNQRSQVSLFSLFIYLKQQYVLIITVFIYFYVTFKEMMSVFKLYSKVCHTFLCNRVV